MAECEGAGARARAGGVSASGSGTPAHHPKKFEHCPLSRSHDQESRQALTRRGHQTS